MRKFGSTQTKAGKPRKPYRRQLAKSELIMCLAVKTLEWQRDVTDDPRSPTIPFEDWTDDDPFRDIALRYRLSGQDLGRILHELGDELEARAMRAGYEEAWIGMDVEEIWGDDDG